MQAIEAHLTPHQIDYDAADNHIICIEHNTTNTTGRMIAKASTTEYSDNFDDFTDPVDLQDGVRDVIALVHNIVRSIRASTIRSSSETKEGGLVMRRFLSYSYFVM